MAIVVAKSISFQRWRDYEAISDALPVNSFWSPHPRYRLYTSSASYLPRLNGIDDACERLESEVCRRFGVEAAVCVPMARTGIYLTLAETIQPGQEVVLSPLTIVDVVNAVVCAGGIPVFADVCRETCAIDPRQADSLINGRTGAVLLTHLHGQNAGTHIFREVPDRDTLLESARRQGRDFAAQHLRNCADLPEFRELYRDCPRARATAAELVLLPTYPGYPLAEARRNIEIVVEHQQRKS